MRHQFSMYLLRKTTTLRYYFAASWRGRVNSAPDPEQALKDFIARQKMKRVGTPEEIASAVLHLASDESSYTTGASQRLHLLCHINKTQDMFTYLFTGTCMVIDGGWSI